MQAQEYPLYRLIQPLYADDQLIEADREIEYLGCPNEHMQPLNEAARQRMNDYLPQITRKGLADRVYEAVADRPKEATVRFPEADKTVPIMPHVQTPGAVQREPRERLVAKVVDPAAETSKRRTAQRVMGAEGGVNEVAGVVRTGGALQP